MRITLKVYKRCKFRLGVPSVVPIDAMMSATTFLSTCQYQRPWRTAC